MAVTGFLATPSVMAQTTLTLNGASGTSTYTATQSTTGGLTINQVFGVEYLVVGGEAGGGNNASGGGGAGGVWSGSTTLTAGAYPVMVGAGGTGGLGDLTAPVVNQGTAGGASSFNGLTAGGGGAPGDQNAVAASSVGGSGGGGGGGTNGPGQQPGGTTSGTMGLANNGAAGVQRGPSGGGGGAGAAGSGRNGGIGFTSSITGTSVTYASGGGGGGYFNSGSGTGGTDAGNGGSIGTSGTSNATNATTNGSGGGGAGSGDSGAGVFFRSTNGGIGGSGIVVVRYEGATLAGLTTGTTSGTGTISTSNFTGSGSNGTNGQLYQVTSFTIGSSTTSSTFSFDMSSVDLNARLGTTMTGVISGSGGLTYNGTGRLTLAANNTYTGATAVNSGSMFVNGQLAAESAVTVSSGALLGGTGSILGSVSVLSGGTFSPGTSPGLISVGSLTLAGTTLMEIDGISPRGGTGGYDAADVTGLLTYGGSMLIDFGAGVTTAFPDLTVFDLFNFGSHTGTFSSITTVADGSFYGGLTLTGDGDLWTSTTLGNDQRLQFTHSTGTLAIVPEPSTIGMLIGAAFATAGWRLRRPKKRTTGC